MKHKAAPKKLAKYQRYSKNTKRFAAGGGTDDGELSLDNLSFGQAFNAVRNMVPDAKTFTWRGKKYSTAMAKKSKPVMAKEDLPEVSVTARTPAKQRADAYDPLAHYGREEANWEDLSPALTPDKPRGTPIAPPNSFTTKTDYDLFNKIRAGSTPPPGYYPGKRAGGKIKAKSKCR